MSNFSFTNSTLSPINTTAGSSTQATLAQAGSIDVVYYIAYVTCGAGVFTNILNVLVFISPKLKDSTYNLMMANSIVDIAFLTVSGLSISIYCGDPCLPNYFTLAGQIMQIWFVNYILRSLAILTTLIEIFISFQRLMLIKNKPFLKDVSVVKVLVVLTIISLLFYLPAFFTAKISSTYSPLVFLPNSTQIDFTRSKLIYFGAYTDFGTSRLSKIIMVALTIIRICLSTIVLLLINILSALEFQKRIQKKLNMAQKTNLTSKK